MFLKSWTVCELLGRTQSFTDTRTAGPSDETLSVPLEGTAQGHLFKMVNTEYSVCIATSICLFKTISQHCVFL